MNHQLSGDELVDEALCWPVTGREDVADLKVFGVRLDHVEAPDGEELVRGYLHHPGAVAIIALDDEDRVAVVRQYRHPVGQKLVEAPAGLLDVEGEDAWSAARRELAEEVQLAADDWRVLLDVVNTGGSSQESLRIFLARGLRPTPRPEGFEVAGEEADMEVAWARVDDVVAACLAGRLQNVSLGMGVLALHAARSTGRLDDLRTPDAPWPARAAKDAVDDACQPR